MLIPSYDRFYKRSNYLKMARKTRRRQLLKELKSYLRGYKSPLDPIPARQRKVPTYMELMEYWDVAT